MKTEIVLQVKQENVHKFQKGYPLITKDAVVNIGDLKEEGCAVKLVDRSGNFLAKGYYGKQNKGIGWILTRNKNDIFNQAFFDKKLNTAVTHRKNLFNDEGTTAFRVFNGEGDGIGGVTIDHYEGHYVISWYSQGIYQYLLQNGVIVRPTHSFGLPNHIRVSFGTAEQNDRFFKVFRAAWKK